VSTAKEIRVLPIAAKDANKVIAAVHYSGSFARNSQLHFGVFLGGKCGGALQFGPSMDKGKIVGLVRETPWNGFLELNRMAFADWLPRNSESRALGYCMRFIRKAYPHVQWIVSFSDATQCGDGTIYRASGFVLTGIKRNTQIVEFPDGFRATRLVLTSGDSKRMEIARKYGAKLTGGASLKPFFEVGARIMRGFQLRYVYFLDPAARSRLTVPEVPFSEIDRVGAKMYKGVSRAGAAQAESVPSRPEGATPIHPLQDDDEPDPTA
jgi:hypothetical protein